MRIKRIANPRKIFVLVAVVTGLNPLSVSTIKLLAELLTKPVTLNSLLVQQDRVINSNDLLHNPVTVYLCEMCH